MRASGVTAVKRSLERRDFLTLLLAAPERMLREDDVITADCQQDHTVRRLAAHLNDGKLRLFPSHELESVLHALAEECRASRTMDRQPLNRPRRRTVHNNLHSILRLVERIIHQRYESRPNCHDVDDTDFLDDELKQYFGANDLSFQIEEDILSLAFRIAVDAVVQSVESVVSISTSLTDDGIVSEKCPSSEVPPVPIIICNNLPSEDIITTALRIIDSAVLINRRMRAKLEELQKSRRANETCFSANITDKRKKYEHLLKPKIRRHDNGRKRSKHTVAYAGVMSAMEENDPRQWEWLRMVRKKLEEQKSPPSKPVAKSSPTDADFVIVRRRIETLDDISLSSSDECDDSDMNDELGMEPDRDDSSMPDTKEDTSNSIPELKNEPEHAASDDPAPIISPFERLDLETHQLRLVLLDMSPGDSSSTEVVHHTVGEIVNLLRRYGDLDGAPGIARCGNILGGRLAIDVCTKNVDGGNPKQRAASSFDRFPLNDATVSSLVTAFLTDATGALRANAFLRSFVLPLMIDMNPMARAIAAGGSTVRDDDGTMMGMCNDQGSKPASRALTSLLMSLSRERPMECVISVIVPSLVMTTTEHIPSMSSSASASFEPTRFQCELITRVLRGKDALSVQAVAVLVGMIVPPTKAGGVIGSIDESAYNIGGMKWTEGTMPVLTACLNCKPTLPDVVVMSLADTISRLLQRPTSGNGTSSSYTNNNAMTRSIKFSTLFHSLVVKYGTQLKSTRRIEQLLDSSSRLETFISKSICLALRKLA
jgi:hypothetical protein